MFRTTVIRSWLFLSLGCFVVAVAPAKSFCQNKYISSSASVSVQTATKGQVYSFHLDVRNNHTTEEARVEARVTSVGGDTLITKGWQTAWVGPGKTHRFSFTFRFDGGGGTIGSEFESVFSDDVKFWVKPLKELYRPDGQVAVYRQFKNYHPSRNITITVNGNSRVAAAGGGVARIWVGRSDKRLAWENVPWVPKWEK